jgi:hypothetical protein
VNGQIDMARPARQQTAYELVEPDASAMMESLRAFGYSTPAAIADLIDNSITAGAKNVWINFFWDGPNSYVSILDDGCGMTEGELTRAMRAGSRSPLEERAPDDLGRFGLGLKTASFSRCRQLTVSSKSKGQPRVTRRWDLDHVRDCNQWRLLKNPAEGSAERLAGLNGLKHGTVVLWENMDRVVSEANVASEPDYARFRDLIDTVEEHIAMVFHRFLGPSQLQVFINGAEDRHRVRPWDPFLPSHPATQQLPAELIRHRGGVVSVRPFVLPHQDKLGERQHRKAAGPAGWNAQQGFYVYRNERLLVAGDWLGLGFTKEEHYKLARIQVDLPNTMDSDWDIDVKKSRARPPGPIRDRLRNMADLTRSRAVEVYRHRGKYGARRPPGEEAFAWRPGRRKDRVVYLVNREHPLVASVLEGAGDNRPAVEALLRLLEETVPVRQIWLDAAEQPEGHARPFEAVPEKEVKQVMEQVFAALRRSGLSAHEARGRVATMDAFTAYPHLVATLGD